MNRTHPDEWRVYRSQTPCMPSTPDLPADCLQCARRVDSLRAWKQPLVIDATVVRWPLGACPMRVAGEEARAAA
jgi:hypothetical protein